VTITEPRVTVVKTSKDVERYSLFERIVHWVVGVTFLYLLLSGMALAYPRLAWLANLLGGGQTMRAAHPWVGVVFTLGLLVMVFLWAGAMRFEAGDRDWVRKLKEYTRTGHTGLDTGRYNAGQKGYYWVVLAFGAVLFITGIPLWYPWMVSSGWRQAARLVHNWAYLVMLAGFMIHVYMSTVMFPGTVSGMTSGKVSRRWASWHHPKWLREKDGGEA
jgi:formate dehydrogenase subunit gamma